MKKRKETLLKAFEEFLDSVFNQAQPDEQVATIHKLASDKILSFAEVCKHFHVSPTTLERYTREGLKYSQAVRKGNRLFKLSDCEIFFNIKNN